MGIPDGRDKSTRDRFLENIDIDCVYGVCIKMLPLFTFLYDKRIVKQKCIGNYHDAWSSKKNKKNKKKRKEKEQNRRDIEEYLI